MRFLKLGEDVRIWESAVIKYCELSSIGDHVAIDRVVISTPIEIEGNVHISSGAVIIGGKNAKVVLKKYSFVSANSTLIAGSEDFVSGKMVGAMCPIEFRDLIIKPIIFERYSGCGAGSIILPGVMLAEGSVIGAGSVVTKNTEPWGIYVGSPAQRIGTRPSDYILCLEREGKI